jgi:hypothetical protein
MRLHLPASAILIVGLATSSAYAGDVKTASKPLEGAPGSTRPQKKTQGSTFAPQTQLFVEQKDAPANSKTALRLESTSRLSTKSKD